MQLSVVALAGSAAFIPSVRDIITFYCACVGADEVAVLSRKTGDDALSEAACRAAWVAAMECVTALVGDSVQQEVGKVSR